ncbi:uncharacterized protein KGF55_001521 [Candida pseudojiufengensis]|uniref:uncharacterized protein n=1 Tax=Candida pseudojiufengensis TaxID=497109 RepID=UPI0022256345|nr:uncharacterized protein KGF55_001521 [Candida pseudojiufengensis]KAI5965301.1 hypothetical protein KGF55_001521 [Candida pseudojiufengensis]
MSTTSQPTDRKHKFTTTDYRGATIEDLDLPPAISINPSTSIKDAIQIGFEYDFTYLPIIHEINKKLLGILNLDEINNNTSINPNDKVLKYMFWFSKTTQKKYEQSLKSNSSTNSNTALKSTIIKPNTGKRYTVLTPFSPLEDLANFFNRENNYFAIITNDNGNFVYGVITVDDLIKYEKRRFKL